MLLLLSLICACSPQKNDDDSNSNAQAIAELEAQRLSLKKEIEELSVVETPTSLTVLCFDSINKSIYELVYPMMQTYSYPGVVVLKGDLRFGEDDNMDLSQISELLDAGWELALGDSGDLNTRNKNYPEVDELSDYIDARLEYIAGLGLERPTTFCFTLGYYDPKYDEVLAEKGFSIVRHFGEKETYLFAKEITEPIWHVGADYIHAGDTIAQATLEKSIKFDTIMSLTTGKVENVAKNASVDCNEAKYAIVLDTLSTYAKLSDCGVATFKGAYDYRKSFDENFQSNDEERRERLAEIEARIAEIDEKIAAIMHDQMSDD